MTSGLYQGRLLAPALFLTLLTSGAVAASSTPFTLVGGSVKTLAPAALAAAERTATPGQASPDRKVLVFRQKLVRLVAVTGPENDMLSYRVDGLRNPTLIVPKGAALRVLFVNADDDMFHNIRFGSALKAYPNMMTAYLKTSTGTPPLPHKSAAVFHGEELMLRAPRTPGTYAYLCTVRGHAQSGMVGKIIVR